MFNKLALFFKRYILILVLCVVYIFALNAMTGFDARGVTEGLGFTLPAILAVMVWCLHAFNNYDFKLKSYSSYHESYTDLFLIFYAFFIGGLIFMCLEKNNVDLRGWWPFVLLFQSVIYMIFSFLFTSLFQIIPRHKLYTYIWFFIILFSLPALHYLPFKTNIWLLGSVDTFYMLLLGYLFVNAFIILIWKKVRELWNNKT